MAPTKPARVAEILRNTVLLNSLSDDEIQSLAARVRDTQFAAGQTIFRKGARGTHAYWVVKGRIKITTSARNGSELLLGMIEVGEHCGEISTIEGGTRSSNAIADTACDVFALSRRDLVAAIERHPETAMKLVWLLTGHIRQAVTMIELLGLHSSETRIWCRLRDLAIRYPQADSKRGSVRIVHGLSQQSLADSVGLTRVMVNRQLSTWRELGFIEYSRGVIVIADPAAFEAYVWREPTAR